MSKTSHIAESATASDFHSGPSSSTDLSQTVGDVRVARAHASAVSLNPRVTRGAPVSLDLPASYARNSVRVVPRGAKQIVVFWDVDPETAAHYAASRWGVLVRTRDGIQGIEIRHDEIRHDARCVYVDVSSTMLGCDVEFGPLSSSGTVTAIARATLPGSAQAVLDAGGENQTFWAHATSTPDGTRLEGRHAASANVDTDAVFDLCRLGPGPSSLMHSWAR